MERTHSNRSTVDDDISVFQQPGSYPGSYANTAKISPPKAVSEPPPPGVVIKDVWDEDFEEEAYKVMKLVEKYKFVAIDTEFPGFLVKPTGPADYYKALARNVEELKIIQVGFSFSDENGKVPEGVNTWQFNLKFDIEKDISVSDSIALLKNCGINFENLAKKGIPHTKFAEWLTISDLAFNDDIKWVAFNGGFDFAYLLRMLSNTKLPDKEDEFYKMLQVYFPTFYDVKYITKDLDNLYYCSLAKLTEQLGIKRIGMTHQAGSDALVTLEAFFRLKSTYLRNHLDNYKYANVLDGMHVENDMMKDYFTNYGAPTLFADYSYPPTPSGYMNFTPIALTPQTHGMMYRGYYDFQVASMLAATTPVKLLYTGPYMMDNGM